MLSMQFFLNQGCLYLFLARCFSLSVRMVEPVFSLSEGFLSVSVSVFCVVLLFVPARLTLGTVRITP